MSRIETHYDKPLGKKHEREDIRNNAAYFISVARKIGFNEQEIAQMTELYRAELEEAKNEHRPSI